MLDQANPPEKVEIIDNMKDVKIKTDNQANCQGYVRPSGKEVVPMLTEAQTTENA